MTDEERQVKSVTAILRDFPHVLPSKAAEMSNVELALEVARHSLATSGRIVCDSGEIECKKYQYEEDFAPEIELIDAVLKEIAPRERGNVEAI